MILTTEQKLQLENGKDLYIEGINHIGQPFSIKAYAWYSTDLYSTDEKDVLAVIYYMSKNRLTKERQELYTQIDLSFNQDVNKIEYPGCDNARLIALRLVDASTEKVFWEMSDSGKKHTLANAYAMRQKLVKTLAQCNEIIVTEQDVITDDVSLVSIKNLGAPITYETRNYPTLQGPYTDTIAPVYLTRNLDTGSVKLYGYGYMSILDPGVQRLTNMEINDSTRCCKAHRSVKYFESANNSRMPSWRKSLVYKQHANDEIEPPQADFVDEREGK